ncbi:MAG: hypothetical protein ONB37_03410 [candidate division KSB1 bacterium]|nr:hypothetical protein [candidate division KSB1 bacterium]
MSDHWISYQSFVKNQQLLEAINTLSIHTKLKLAGDADSGRSQEVEQAKQQIAHFITTFDQLIQKNNDDQTLHGADERLRQLLQDFYSARRDNQKFRSQFFTKSPSQILKLMASDKTEDEEALVECLRELRLLIEQHVHADTTAILGEF